MINFTDDRLYAKGTCNVILSDVVTGDIYYQTNKMSTGSITPSTNLNEIRAGLGNPIAAMIPSDSSLAVDFDAADFSIWAKSAQLGATLSYSAPVPTCQTVTASGAQLSITVADATPVAPLGLSDVVCYVQTVGAASLIGTDGTAYGLDPASGAITGFTATAGTQYKVWYFINKPSARMAKISSFIDPKVVRFEAQIAVYSNRGGQSEGTRVGWLYYTIPCLKLQGDATVSGDQSNNDVTKISGQAIAYDAAVVSDTCTDCDSSTLGYMVYAPDNASESISGLTVFGGVVEVESGESAQVPVRFVMADGSTARPGSYSQGFTYALTGAPGGTTVSTDGVITAGSTAGDCDLTITYTDGANSYTCLVSVSVVTA